MDLKKEYIFDRVPHISKKEQIVVCQMMKRCITIKEVADGCIVNLNNLDVLTIDAIFNYIKYKNE